MEKEKAKRAIEIMKELAKENESLKNWQSATKYYRGENEIILSGYSIGLDIARYMPFESLKNIIIPIIQNKICDLETKLENL